MSDKATTENKPLLAPESFAYWLQGFCELHKEAPTPEQWEIIKHHLELVFTKIHPVESTGAFDLQGVWRPTRGLSDGLIC